MLLDYLSEGIKSERLLYRHLAEEDATKNYLSWFDDHQVKEFMKEVQNLIKDNIL